LEFKAQQEAERAATEEKKAQSEADRTAALAQTAAALDTSIEDKEKEAAKKQKHLDGLNEKTKIAKQEAAEYDEIDKMAKPALIGGNLQISPDNWKKVSGLAKEGVKSRGIIAGLKKQITGFIDKIKELTAKLTRYEGMGISDTMKYYEAMKRAPRRLAETVEDIRRQPPERQEQQRTPQERKRNNNLEIGG
jgi:hypothetical protein